jgi:hypothetical protein
MTAFEIDILLHYATTRGDHPHMRNPPPIWRETIDRFMAEGLLTAGGGEADAAYVATDRLRAYSEALQSVPLPVQAWPMPPQKPVPPDIARIISRNLWKLYDDA